MEEGERAGELSKLLAIRPAFEYTEFAVEAAGPWASWTLARQLWYLRLRSGMTQAEFAWRSGLSREEICRLERGGDPRWSTLERFFCALGYYPLLMPERLFRGKADRHWTRPPRRRVIERSLRPARTKRE